MKKRHVLIVLLVVLGMIAGALPAFADGPSDPAVPTVPDEPSQPPTIVDPAEPALLPDCPFPSIWWEEDCAVTWLGEHTKDEVVDYLQRTGHVNDVIGTIDTLTGVAEITIAHVLRYVRTITKNYVGVGTVTTIQVGATCRLFVQSERLNEDMYYKCVAVLSHALSNFNAVLCPALEKIIVLFGSNPGTASQKKTLESALAAQAAYCASAKVKQIIGFLLLTPARVKVSAKDVWKQIRKGGAKKVLKEEVAEPPLDPTPPSSPEEENQIAVDAQYCPYPFYPDGENDECVFLLDGHHSPSEVGQFWRTIAVNNPFLVVDMDLLDSIIPFIKTSQLIVEGVPTTIIRIGQTCREWSDALRLDYMGRMQANANCLDTLAIVNQSMQELACPALEAFIARMVALKNAGTITANQVRALGVAIATHGRLCAGFVGGRGY